MKSPKRRRRTITYTEDVFQTVQNVPAVPVVQNVKPASSTEKLRKRLACADPFPGKASLLNCFFDSCARHSRVLIVQADQAPGTRNERSHRWRSSMRTDISTITPVVKRSPATCPKAINCPGRFRNWTICISVISSRTGATQATRHPKTGQISSTRPVNWTVLYPTAGLAVGRIMAEEWAVVACTAYNTWLYERFLNRSPRLKGVALIPFQNVDAGISELRRAVKELGMLGGMLPSNGEAIQGHLGNKIYWPLYAEAEKLGCALAVHVGCLHHMGLDAFSTYYPVHALGHPFSLMIQAAGMLAHGIFERFPKLRVAFLEGGATWVPFFMDRLARSYHD